LDSATLECGDASPLSYFPSRRSRFQIKFAATLTFSPSRACEKSGFAAISEKYENMKATMHRRTPKLALSN